MLYIAFEGDDSAIQRCQFCVSLSGSLFNILQLLERVLDARIRRRVEGDFGEEQQGFRKGRGTADGMYVLRQMVEKRLEVQGSMALGFVDLEKAFDTVPRERWRWRHYGGWEYQKRK